MSELHREQRPLLCDELSDEERFRPTPRRFRPMVCVGRARNHVKGATAIIDRWPDHWSSSLKYWWTGIGMISITIFIIYNILFAFALIPPENIPATQVRTSNKKIEHIYKGTSSLPDIFMHILVNSNKEVDLNRYLPYIETISKENLDFKYYLIIVLNDMVTETNSLSAEEQNGIALNSLWSKEHFDRKDKVIKNNINIEYVTLSKFMHESPIRKYWKQLPITNIEFLIRAVSIWEKGGIALNPKILTPQSPHAIYKEKFVNILQRYQKCKAKTRKHQQQKQAHHKEKNKKKVNNIRDIIENLERDGGSSNSSQISLTEVENKISPVVMHRQLLSVAELLKTTDTNTEQLKDITVNPNFYSYLKHNESNSFDDKQHSKNGVKPHDTFEIIKKKAVQDLELISDPFESKNSSLSLLPLFLEFLFYDKPKNNLAKMNNEYEMKRNITRQRKSVLPIDNSKKNKNSTSFGITNNTETKLSYKYEPMIISAKGIIPKEQRKINETNEVLNTNEKHDHLELTLDLEGNIMATETPCHAFLGTVFSNVIYHTEEETLKDFIIAELSIFCKGLLSSCKGIDVILL